MIDEEKLFEEPSAEELLEDRLDDIDHFRKWANSWDHSRTLPVSYVWTEQTEQIYRDIFLKHYGIIFITGEQGSGKDAFRIGLKERRIQGYRYAPNLAEFLRNPPPDPVGEKYQQGKPIITDIRGPDDLDLMFKVSYRNLQMRVGNKYNVTTRDARELSTRENALKGFTNSVTIFKIPDRMQRKNVRNYLNDITDAYYGALENEIRNVKFVIFVHEDHLSNIKDLQIMNKAKMYHLDRYSKEDALKIYRSRDRDNCFFTDDAIGAIWDLARGNFREMKKLISLYLDEHEDKLLQEEPIDIGDIRVDDELKKFKRIKELSKLYNDLSGENARRTYYNQVEFVIRDAHEKDIKFNKDRDFEQYAKMYHPNLKLYGKKISLAMKPIRDKNSIKTGIEVLYRTLIWVDRYGYYRLPDEKEE